ncbi:MAG: sulfurtransferase TusA family protein [Gammaproteobacteria bacterium]
MAHKHTLDARRLLCPLPVIRVQEKVSGLSSGDVLEVWCTDPGARSDIPAWCRINGHRLLDISESDGELTLILEVGERTAPGSPYE